MLHRILICIVFIAILLVPHSWAWAGFTVPDTGQAECYDNAREISSPDPGAPFYGQDAQYAGPAMHYQDNGDGTVTDLVTGLMWVKDPGDKVTWEQGMAGAAQCSVGGYTDWRVPTVKELYSLMDFSGYTGRDESSSKPYVNTDSFGFEYGDESAGERIIDSQWMTTNIYGSTVMNHVRGMFGVNFADGRIKGYPIDALGPRGEKTFFVRYVRGGEGYGVNDFVDNGDGTVTDRASGLMWMQVDSGALNAGPSGDGSMNWEQALAWAESLEYAGHSDWRLPNIKELQSIVDYERSPDITGSAALDPVFQATAITNPGGETDYPYYWSSTTHMEDGRASAACYVAFGRALGYMSFGNGPSDQGGPPSGGQGMAPPSGGPGQGPPPGGRYMPPPPGGQGLHTGPGQGVGPGPGNGQGGEPQLGNVGGELMDVHGAGAQRSDPKSGDPGDYEWGRGPQGDVVYIDNYVRLVRDAR